MHILQPKHIKLSEKEISELLEKYNISKSQLPRIRKEDSALPADCKAGDVIRIERKKDEGKAEYFRLVV